MPPLPLQYAYLFTRYRRPSPVALSALVLPEDTLNDGGDAADIGVPVTEGGIRGVVEGSAAAPGPPEEGRDRRDSTKDTLDATAARHRAQGTRHRTRRRTLQPLYTAKVEGRTIAIQSRLPPPVTGPHEGSLLGAGMDSRWGHNAESRLGLLGSQ